MRSVDREVVGRNVSERENSPEIDRGRSSRLYPVKGKAEIAGRDIASDLRCSRGSYRQHAIKGIDVNKGDPSGSSASLYGLPSR